MLGNAEHFSFRAWSTRSFSHMSSVKCNCKNAHIYIYLVYNFHKYYVIEFISFIMQSESSSYNFSHILFD